jgi:hypothetical protein
MKIHASNALLYINLMWETHQKKLQNSILIHNKVYFTLWNHIFLLHFDVSDFC